MISLSHTRYGSPDARHGSDLADRPYLQPLYDRPEFIVRNLLRLYGGWWNGNPAELLPAREDALARMVSARLQEYAPGQVVIRVRASGMCGTDLHLHHGVFPLKPPIVAEVKVSSAEAQAQLSRSQVATAQAALEQAQAALAQAELNLSYTKIYATESGSVAITFDV